MCAERSGGARVPSRCRARHHRLKRFVMDAEMVIALHEIFHEHFQLNGQSHSRRDDELHFFQLKRSEIAGHFRETIGERRRRCVEVHKNKTVPISLRNGFEKIIAAENFPLAAFPGRLSIFRPVQMSTRDRDRGTAASGRQSDLPSRASASVWPS